MVHPLTLKRQHNVKQTITRDVYLIKSLSQYYLNNNYKQITNQNKQTSPNQLAFSTSTKFEMNVHAILLYQIASKKKNTEKILNNEYDIVEIMKLCLEKQIKECWGRSIQFNIARCWNCMPEKFQISQENVISRNSPTQQQQTLQTSMVDDFNHNLYIYIYIQSYYIYILKLTCQEQPDVNGEKKVPRNHPKYSLCIPTKVGSMSIGYKSVFTNIY
eukprot:TRINITY_DN4222_c1_g1_i1.p1 TRINITY_DN4222_c1_g1~~TRINITY_DN4222_c1_g1_i1.p1  ORF type:complete len:216 (+),score=-4.49 TRINITY_DN4222_c1_g1_i1:322-969(+)